MHEVSVSDFRTNLSKFQKEISKERKVFKVVRGTLPIGLAVPIDQVGHNTENTFKVSSQHFRSQNAQLLNRVCLGDTCIVTCHNEPTFAIVPICEHVGPLTKPVTGKQYVQITFKNLDKSYVNVVMDFYLTILKDNGVSIEVC